VQCRADDQITLERVRPIDDPETRAAVSAERAFLQTLESGCSAPVGALAAAGADGVEMRGLVAAIDAAASIRVSGHGRDPVELGHRLGREALQAGARDLVDRDE
jgi:hydroxymethylbilane synthase